MVVVRFGKNCKMAVVRFGEECKAVIDEEVRGVKVSDGRTAIVKLVFNEDWKLREILVNDIYVWRGKEQ